VLAGHQIIAGQGEPGSGPVFRAVNPADAATLAPDYASATATQVDAACNAARDAFPNFGNTAPDQRASLLEAVAAEIEAVGEALIERAMVETGLPEARLQGERGRTTGQLRMFAELLRQGDAFKPVVDAALPDRQPAPRPHLVRLNRPLGPVAVFGAANFPLAFSVAGGDSASALAAGCPLVVKAHPGHPGTSEIVGRAIARAVEACGLPGGVFSLLFDDGHAVGGALVQHPAIKAVGFTGSRRGGLALSALATARPEPIPFHAEMGSINPVFFLPAALSARPQGHAEAVAASMQMGAGQFCTQPGLLVAIEGSALDAFAASLAVTVEQAVCQTMLTPGIFQAYQQAVERRSSTPGVMLLAQAGAPGKPDRCRPCLFAVDAGTFLADASLAEEIFGASSLLVRCRDADQMRDVARSLEGQLTATLQLENADESLARDLMPVLERVAGRVLCNGYPTGVEVCAAMMHGGPYPATTDGRTTSVGTAAMQRWLRPVCFQGLPDFLQPEAEG